MMIESLILVRPSHHSRPWLYLFCFNLSGIPLTVCQPRSIHGHVS